MGKANLQKTLAGRVKNLRTTAGFTQAALAERSGLSVKQITRIESGLANPTLSALQALANALDVDPGVLFDASAAD